MTTLKLMKTMLFTLSLFFICNLQADCDVLSIAISGGGVHSLSLDTNSNVCAWGNNSFGQLGDRLNVDSHIPKIITTLPPIIAIAAGNNHSLVIDNVGAIWGWGLNLDGQLGVGDFVNKSSPTQHSPPFIATKIAA